MATLKDAVLAKRVIIDSTGIKSMVDSIIDREEFVCPVPSEFPVVLGIVCSGEPGEVIDISTEVLSHMNRPLWFDSGQLKIPDTGKGNFPIHIPIPVRDVGPCYIVLRFNNNEVWRQRISFALA